MSVLGLAFALVLVKTEAVVGAVEKWESRVVGEISKGSVGAGGNLLLVDAGCGGGGACVLAAERGAFISGLDAAQALLAIAQRRVPRGDFRRGDLEALPFPDQFFDAILACN